jgi:disulfide bond formation protein DsbB
MRESIRGTDSAYSAGAATLLVALGAIGAALGFEHIGGYRPCPLCLMERWAYYASIPTLFVALVLVRAGWLRTAGLLFALVSLAFLANAGLGAYHAGAEWGFWPGPDTCATAPPANLGSGNLLDSLRQSDVVRCDKAPWTFLGLSFAGWNVVVSLAASVATLRAAVASNFR